NGAVITLSPSPVDFGTTPVGVAKNSSLTVGNSGASVLSVTSMSIASAGGGTPAFTFDDPALNCVGGTACSMGFQVSPPGTPRTVGLSCDPTARGTQLATLSVTSNATSGTSSVTLTCVGTAPAVGATPSSFSFGTIRVNTQAQTTISLENDGNAT